LSRTLENAPVGLRGAEAHFRTPNRVDRLPKKEVVSVARQVVGITLATVLVLVAGVLAVLVLFGAFLADPHWNAVDMVGMAAGAILALVVAHFVP
jgi:membrane protein YdbS with pleckstrin-like domain